MSKPRLTSYADLLAYLGTSKLPIRRDEPNQVVELPVNSPPLSGLLYVRWEKHLPYVQIIHPFVLNVPEDRVRDVETAICRANTIIPLPGLGFEYSKRFVYMRLCVPVYEEGIEAHSLELQIAGVLQNARDFIGPFRDILAGHAGSDVLGLAVKHKVETEGRSMPEA